MKPLLEHDHPRCAPVRSLLQMIGSKWAVLIVLLLRRRPARFSELKRAIGGITQKSLTASLRELEKDGLVERKVTPVLPPRVDYQLTALGRSLVPALDQLSLWAVENDNAVADARARYEAAQAA
jgi:DNA-binding HxlR family transcriptional regulator